MIYEFFFLLALNTAIYVHPPHEEYGYNNGYQKTYQNKIEDWELKIHAFYVTNQGQFMVIRVQKLKFYGGEECEEV